MTFQEYVRAAASGARFRAHLDTRLLLGVTAVALLAPSLVLANPIGGTVTTGSATISAPSKSTTNVNQKSEGVVIDWSSFNIASGQTTNFLQPNKSAIAVNRIGGANASTILGTLDANGRVVLINGNGILFGKNAQVNVGSLVATSTDGSDADVLAGKFTKAGSQNASIINKGSITAAAHGTVALVAPNVSNSGTVQAKLGTVSLGGANAFTVDFKGDGLVSFAAQGDVNGKASVTNRGSLSGANVAMTARAAEGVATGVVNERGVIEAKAAHGVGGTVVLDGGTSGNIDVAHGKIEASGAKGGGSVTVGGWNQASVVVTKNSVIDASATKTGNGGMIVVRADGTSYRGEAIAQGGKISGHGGSVETSGHVVDVSGAHVNTLALNGLAGNWTLDPENVTISTGATSNGSISGGVFTPTGDDSVLNRGDLEAALGSTNIEVTTGSTGTQAGNIAVDDEIVWSTTTKLTLHAAGDIFLRSNVVTPGNFTAITTKAGDKISIDELLSAGTVTLVSAGTITENIPHGRVDATYLEGSSVGGTSLNGFNVISNLSTFTNTGAGNIALSNSGPINLGGALTNLLGDITITASVNGDLGNGRIAVSREIAAETVRLNATGTISEDITKGSIHADYLEGTSSYGASLTGANMIANLSTFTNTNGGNVALTDGETLNTDGDVNAGPGNLTLTTTGAGTDIDISRSLVTAGTVNLNSAGGITESNTHGSIDTNTLAGSSTNSVSLNGDNEIATLSTFTDKPLHGTNFSFTDIESFGVLGPITYGSGNISLTATGKGGDNIIIENNLTAEGVTLVSNGMISENATTGAIDAESLAGSSVGGTTLNGNNEIARLAGFTNTGGGNISLTNIDALDVAGAVTNTNGYISLNLTGAGNGLTIAGSLSAEQVGLFVNGGIDENITTGTISANVLTGTTVGSGASLNGANKIGALSNFTNTDAGNIEVTDAQTLDVDGAVRSDLGNITLTTTGVNSNLLIDGSATGADGNGKVTLDSAGLINENANTGYIGALELTGSSIGGTSLQGTSNEIEKLSNFTNAGSGGFALTNSGSLDVDGTVNSGPGNLTLTTVGGGDLHLDGNLTSAGLVTLTSAGTIDENKDLNGVITANELGGTSVGGTSLLGTNKVNYLEGFTNTGADGFAFIDGQRLNVNGPVSGGTGNTHITVTSGKLVVSGDISGANVKLVSDTSMVDQTSGAITATGALSVHADDGITLDGDNTYETEHLHTKKGTITGH